jgi:ElaB/YqjD/DUF883 family membrane-anchored ribosome-binding protein
LKEKKMSEKMEEKRIKEALDVLDEMAKNQKAELQALVASKYSNLTALFGGIVEEIGHQAQATYKEGRDHLMDIVSSIDKKVRENPWPYIGAAALGCLFIGNMQGKSKK